MRWLITAAWAALLVDAAGLGWLLANELGGGDPLSRSIGRSISQFTVPPLFVLFVALAISTRLRSRVGLWICLVLAAVPIILALSNIARHSA